MEDSESYFLEMLPGDAEGKRYELREGENTIGRHDSNSICVNTRELVVSNRHATIIISPAGISIEDLNSTNGTYVNKCKISQKALEPGDEIGLGQKGPRFILVSSRTVNTHQDNAAPPLPTNTVISKSEDLNFETGPLPAVPEQIKKSSDHNSLNLSGEFSLTDELDGTGSAHHLSTKDDKVSPGSEVKRENFPGKGNTEKSNKRRKVPDNFTSLSMSLSLDDLPLDNPCKSETNGPAGSSLTMEIQGRLQQEVINTQDIKLLVKDNEKYNKVIKNQALGYMERRMLEKFRKAYLSMRNTLFVIFGAVMVVILAVTIFFAVGYIKRGEILKNAVEVKQQLDSYERKIENARNSSGGQDLKDLYAQLETKQRQFDSLKAFLDQKSQKRIFSDTIEYFLDEIMRQFNESNYNIPPSMLLRVKYYIEFNTKRPAYVKFLLQNRDVYFPQIERDLRQYNVPPVLAYVALQESGLNPRAISPAGAVGLWQFMEKTGKQYGLIINDAIDERSDWKKSTVAAARYFHKLLTEYGKGNGVLLAIASYNAGADRIRLALASIEDPLHDRDFWYLYRTSHVLQDETREYVPKILAWMIIDKHRKLFGL